MRFTRKERYPWEDTPRKRAALRRRQRLEREAFPLLSELIAEQQPDEDTVMAQRAEAAARTAQQWRDGHARKWREARRRLYALGDNLRPVVLAYWNSHRWYPGDPVYLLGLLHSIEVGDMVPDEVEGFRFKESMPGTKVREVAQRLAQQREAAAQANPAGAADARRAA